MSSHSGIRTHAVHMTLDWHRLLVLARDSVGDVIDAGFGPPVLVGLLAVLFSCSIIESMFRRSRDTPAAHSHRRVDDRGGTGTACVPAESVPTRAPQIGLRHDRGAQVERTALAWQRTTIALVVAGITISRLTLPHSLWVTATAAAVCVVPSAALVVLSHKRYRKSTHALSTPQATTAEQVRVQPDARLPVAAAAITAGLCALELAHVLLASTL